MSIMIHFKKVFEKLELGRLDTEDNADMQALDSSHMPIYAHGPMSTPLFHIDLRNNQIAYAQHSKNE